MSVPTVPSPPAKRRPLRPVPTPAVPAPAPSSQVVNLREGLRHVLAGLRYPARRWEIIAEADSWGIGGPLRQALGRLPDGSYPTLSMILDVLTGPARTAPDPGRAAHPDRVVVPMRAPATAPRRPA